MKIAVDIDDVLADSMPVFVEFYQKHYDKNFCYEDIKKFEYLGFLGETKEEAEKKILHFYESEFFNFTKPVIEAIEVVKELSKDHEVFALTSRPIYIKEKTIDWVKKYFPDIKDVWFNNENSTHIGTLTKMKSKTKICIDNKVDYLIEDLLKFANDTHQDLKILLIDRPWNQGSLPRNVQRVYDWQEVINLINS